MRVAGTTAPGGLEISHDQQQSEFCSLHTKTRPSKIGDAIIPPGPWSTSGPLSRGCGQQDLPRQFPGTFWSHGRTNVAGIYRFGEVVQHSGLRISQLHTLSKFLHAQVVAMKCMQWCVTYLPTAVHRALSVFAPLLQRLCGEASK